MVLAVGLSWTRPWQSTKDGRVTRERNESFLDQRLENEIVIISATERLAFRLLIATTSLTTRGESDSKKKMWRSSMKCCAVCFTKKKRPV